jgi:hypothetical protein
MPSLNRASNQILFLNVARFTSSGSWVVPAGVYRARVRLIGGGANTSLNLSNGMPGNGDDGFERDEVVAVTPGAAMPVVVGAVGGNSTAAGLTAAGATAGQASGLVGSDAKTYNVTRERRRTPAGSVSAGQYGMGSVNGAGATAGVVEIWY